MSSTRGQTAMGGVSNVNINKNKVWYANAAGRPYPAARARTSLSGPLDFGGARDINVRGNVKTSGGQNDNINSIGPVTIAQTYYARASAASGGWLYNSRRGRNTIAMVRKERTRERERVPVVRRYPISAGRPTAPPPPPSLPQKNKKTDRSRVQRRRHHQPRQPLHQQRRRGDGLWKAQYVSFDSERSAECRFFFFRALPARAQRPCFLPTHKTRLLLPRPPPLPTTTTTTHTTL
jgi:hypothetical protein